MRCEVHKWYLDCTTEGGEAAIVYAGDVALGRVRLPYAELLALTAGRGPTRTSRLRRAVVDRQGTRLTLEAPAVGVSGTWNAALPAIDTTLFEGNGEFIRWRCHQAGGTADVRLSAGRRLQGSGYVEELTMNVPPWKMPFRELRWGRVAAPDCSLVWIDWRDGCDRRWAFWNGRPVPAGTVRPDLVEWPAGRLDIEPGRVIRDERIGRTVAGHLAWCLPRSLARARETKWLSRGRLHAIDRPTLGVWVIHEVVRWA